MQLTRLQRAIVEELFDQMGHIPTQSELASRVESTQPSVSRALKPLREAGYVRKEKQGYILMGSAVRDFNFLQDYPMAIPSELPRGISESHTALRAIREGLHPQQLDEIRRSIDFIQGSNSTLDSAINMLNKDLSGASNALRAVNQIAQQENFGRSVQALNALKTSQKDIGTARALSGIDIGQTQRSMESIVRELLTTQDRFMSGISSWLSSHTKIEQRFRHSISPVTEIAHIYEHIAPQIKEFTPILEQANLSIHAYSRFSDRILDVLNDQAFSRAQSLVASTAIGRASTVLRDATTLWHDQLQFIEDDVDSEGVVAIEPNFYDQFEHEIWNNIDTTKVLTDDDAETQIASLYSSAIAQVAHRVGQLHVSCNKLAQRLGYEIIFKPSVEVVETSMWLPQAVADDESSFRSIIRGLYMFLYESSGELKRVSAVLDEQDYMPLLELKWIRHDFAHDSGHKDKKALERIGSIYKRWIGKVYPMTETDFAKCQLELLKEIERSLRQLYYELTNKS